MKSKIVLILIMISPLASSPVWAADKQDVSDPVLQEVISAFTPRMPRFIDKHGTGVFVADEAVTRSSLMMALYEYDKSAKSAPTREYASKQELSDIKNRLAMLEKNASSNTRVSSGDHGDITQIINDLAPNMPFLLDSSLNNSQVFTKFKNEVLANRSGAMSPAGKAGKEIAADDKAMEIADLKRRLAVVERTTAAAAVASTAPGKSVPPSPEITELSRRVERLEKTPAAASVVLAPSAPGKSVPQSEIAELYRRVERLEKAPASDSSASASGGADEQSLTEEIQKTRLQEKRDMAKLEKRLGEVENVSYNGKKAGDETKQYSSMLTKMSFGLSMLAALFIAR
jgi:hypothetical protein